MTPSLPIPATLRPSRKRTVVLLLVSTLFLLAGVGMIRDGKPTGYFVAGVFALCWVAFALQLHPKASYLHLAPEGFTFCSLFRAHTVRWDDVREFGVVSISFNRMVTWNFTPEYRATKPGRALSKSLSGYEAALPDTYGLKAQELAELMEELRRRYSRQPVG